MPGFRYGSSSPAGKLEEVKRELNAHGEQLQDIPSGDRLAALESRIGRLEDAAGLHVDASDEARELAMTNGLDLGALAPGSGEEGRVLVADVRAELDALGEG